jgi:hypothetical protein
MSTAVSERESIDSVVMALVCSDFIRDRLVDKY